MSAEFFRAIQAGDAAQVSALIQSDPSLLNAVNDAGLGGYTVAKYSRQEDIARLLLDQGVHLDIFAACMAGVRQSVVDLLARQRDLVDSWSQDGWSPLHLAAFFGHADLAEVLLANGADVHARSRNPMRNTPLHAAVAGRRTSLVSVLLAHGADVNAQQSGGFTPLHAAAQNGDVELAALLIATGADVKARADNHQNALDLALTKGHQAMADLLEEHDRS